MKAQAFLELVGKMMTAQQDYFAARRKSAGVITTQDLLIKSKGLEKQVRAVVKEGRLEADDLPLPNPPQMRESAEFRDGNTLDLSGNPLPTDPTPTLPIFDDHKNGEGENQGEHEQ